MKTHFESHQEVNAFSCENSPCTNSFEVLHESLNTNASYTKAHYLRMLDSTWDAVWLERK